MRRSDKSVVVDAGPLIALARLDLLNLLPRVFHQALTTDLVLEECLHDDRFPECASIRQSLDQRELMVVKYGLENPSTPWQIDPGEASVIDLARERDFGVLIDDSAARAVARRRGLMVIGTCGVLLLAKEQSLISRVGDQLERLTESGYFLGESLCREVLRLAGES